MCRSRTASSRPTSAPVRRPGQPRPGRRRDRAGAGVQPRDPPAAGDRGRARRLRLHPDRLPADARPADRQRSRRRQRGARADPDRVLRAGGAGSVAAQRRPRQAQPQPDRSRCRTIVCVMYDARTKLSDQVVRGGPRRTSATRSCERSCRATVRLSEAPSFGQPIITFDPKSRGAIAYRDVAKEVHDGAA